MSDITRAAAIEPYVVTGNGLVANAYTQIVAATGKACSGFRVRNNSDVAIKLATGAAASEVDIPDYVGPGETAFVRKQVAAGTRLAIRALTAAGTSGYITVNLLN